ERPPVGNFEPADLLPDRPGEGAPLVTEELALEETRGDRRAIQLDERPPSSRAEVVNLTRDELLPGTCLSLDQDDGVGRRNDLGLLEHPAQRTARPHDLLGARRGANGVFDADAPWYRSQRARGFHIHSFSRRGGSLDERDMRRRWGLLNTLRLNCRWTKDE